MPHPESLEVSIRELGTLGGAVSQAKGVNRLGAVAGTSRDGSGRSRAFLWTASSGIVDLRPFTGVNSSANAINDRGDVVGGGDTGFGDFHAYVLSGGTTLDLGTLGGNESDALALNGLGQIAGHSRVGGGLTKRAFFVPELGTMVDLGTLGGATSIAHDVNDRAEVVGFAETERGEAHAFLWTAGRGMRDLATLEGGVSVALGINNRGAIVGGSGRACMWTTDEARALDLGTLGGRTSCANAIDDAGYVVGVSQTGGTDPRGLPATRAFLRTPEGRMLDLGTLGGEHSAAAAIAPGDGGAIWVAGHSHDRLAQVRAVLWEVRLG